jgi:hypothetical protein
MNNLTLAQMAPGIFPHRQAPSRGASIGRHGDGTFDPLGPPMPIIKLHPDGMSIGVGMHSPAKPVGRP